MKYELRSNFANFLLKFQAQWLFSRGKSSKLRPRNAKFVQNLAKFTNWKRIKFLQKILLRENSGFAFWVMTSLSSPFQKFSLSIMIITYFAFARRPLGLPNNFWIFDFANVDKNLGPLKNESFSAAHQFIGKVKQRPSGKARDAKKQINNHFPNIRRLKSLKLEQDFWSLWLRIKCVACKLARSALKI